MRTATRREEMVPIVRRLRDERGLMWHEIGAELGIAKQTACDYYKDPTGEIARARKAKNDGTCIDCGGATKSGGERIPPVRCHACAPKAAQDWPQERVVAAIQRWAEMFGQPPSANDWNTSSPWHKGERVKRWNSGDWPYPSTVVARFGTWNAALEAAGFQPREPYGRRGLPQSEIDRTIALYKQGHTLTAIGRELGVSGSAIRLRLDRAGIPRTLTTGRNEPMAAPLRAEAVIEREIDRIEQRCAKLREELAESENTVARLRLAQEALAGTNGTEIKAA